MTTNIGVAEQYSGVLVNMVNKLKILQHAISTMLLLSVVALPSIAETTTSVNIIDRTEDSITVIDEIGRTITINLPVENIISTDYRQMEVLLAIGAGDMIVGVDSTYHQRFSYLGLNDVPEVSHHAQEVNYEQVLMLEPDLVLVPTWQGATAEEISRNLPGVPVLVLGLSSRDDIIPETQMMGEILDKEDEANKVISFINKYDNIVEDRTKDLEPQDTPTFFFEYMSDLQTRWWAIKPNDRTAGRAAEGCGGINIASDLQLNGEATTVEVEPEWVFSKNPDYIFMDFMGGEMSGPEKTDEDVKNNLDNLIEERASEGFLEFNAVKNNHVYALNRDWFSGPRWVIGHICIAKWLHPDLFEDISPDEINQEYFNEFFGIELEGTWAYPSP